MTTGEGWFLRQIVLAGLIAASLGCSRKGDSSDRPEIVTVVKMAGIPWFNRMEQGVLEAGKTLEVNTRLVGPADADEAQQVRLIEDLINRGVDALCVVPNDARSLEPVFARAKKRGITIITHESPDQKGHDFDVELVDNTAFGRFHWDKLVEYIGPEGDYALFVGSLTVPAHNLWADAGLEYAARTYPGLNLVTERIPCGEDQALARQKTLELLQAYPDLKGIIGFGSLGPIGAAQAVREKKLSDRIAVLGTVMPAHAAPYLREGSLRLGTLWDSRDAGLAMNYVAHRVIQGIEIVDRMEIPGLGPIRLVDRTIILNRPIEITAENAESFGF